MKRLLIMMAMVLVAAGPASAALIVTTHQTANHADYVGDVSASDLINGIAGTHVGMETLFGPTANFLTNGVWAADGSEQIMYDSNGSTSTYLLGGSYDIGKIVTYSGWAGAGQYWYQYYDVDVSSDGGANFVPLVGAAVDFVAGADFQRVTMDDDGGAAIATNVNAIRFNFFNHDKQMISEIDVYEAAGAPPVVVPEPAGLGLVGLALLAVRKRRS